MRCYVAIHSVCVQRSASSNRWVQTVRVTTGTRSQRTARRTQGGLDCSGGHRGGCHHLRDPSPGENGGSPGDRGTELLSNASKTQGILRSQGESAQSGCWTSSAATVA